MQIALSVRPSVCLYIGSYIWMLAERLSLLGALVRREAASTNYSVRSSVLYNCKLKHIVRRSTLFPNQH